MEFILQTKKKNTQVSKNDKILNVIKRDFYRNKSVYLLVAPVVLYYLIFMYVPMFGVAIAFQDYRPGSGFFSGPWVGLSHFKDFVTGIYFFRIIKNTFTISMSSIIFDFPLPIILALLLNSVRSKRYKSFVQSVTYLPYFISLIVICGMIIDFTSNTGLISVLLGYLGFDKVTMLQNSQYFVPIYVISEIWQKSGYGSIIYLAALTNVDPQLYDAANVDGANKWKQLWNVTIPGIMPTIIVMFILRVGNVLNVGFEKIILLYNPVIYDTADVISSYVYRIGLEDMNFSFSAAVDLFNGVISLIFLLSANWLSKKLSNNSLW